MKELILNEKGKEIGYMYTTYLKNNGIRVDILEIHKRYRGKGYGTKLIKRILTEFSYIKAHVDDIRAMEFWIRFNPQITKAVPHISELIIK
jgi:predicted GNAT family acetyltransferase